MVLEGRIEAGSRVALVADVGRLHIKLGLTDERGRLRHDTVRAYEASTQPTVSGAISSFAREVGLSPLPRRLAVAVSGTSRGDTISITHGRWHVSKSGLASMLQAEPLILNDFAATAWAIGSAERSGELESLAGPLARPHGPGTFCVVGMGSGLGVALLARDAEGNVTVIPTEAGHSAFMTGLRDAGPILDIVGARHSFATAEMLLSGPGLVAIYNAVAKLRDGRPVTGDPREIGRLGTTGRDPVAAETLAFFARALWHFAGNMVLAFAAWDGVILTGGMAAALRPLLVRPDLAQHFAVEGPFKRQLASAPRALVKLRNAELEGAAAALLMRDSRTAERLAVGR